MRGRMKVNAIGIGVEHARPRMWARSRSLVTKVIFECCVDVTRVNSPPPGDSTVVDGVRRQPPWYQMT